MLVHVLLPFLNNCASKVNCKPNSVVCLFMLRARPPSKQKNQICLFFIQFNNFFWFNVLGLAISVKVLLYPKTLTVP